MEYRQFGQEEIGALMGLHLKYKEAIGETPPDLHGKERLEEAVRLGRIRFFGAWDGDVPVGCCSVTVGFSTFDYLPSGVFEDFYILPEYRGRGIARRLVQYAYEESGVSVMTVGCADCDLEMYRSLGFRIRLGNLLAFA